MLVALTGATGFVGGHAAQALAERGHDVRALLRPGKTAPAGVSGTVQGDLHDPGALLRLAEGCDAFVHVAGMVAAPREADLFRANAEGADNAAAAARTAGVPRFVLVSSLAAREPGVSSYALSKRRGEEAARASFGREGLAIARPPAVYGPGDRATLPIFKGVAAGRLVMAGTRGQRFSLIHARDLARVLADLAEAPTATPDPIEPDDGRAGLTGRGYSWPELANLAAEATGRPVRLTLLPRGLATAAATLLDGLAALRGRPLEAAPLSQDKLGELYHPDWVARGEPVPGRIGFVPGAKETLAWYREQGWLR